MSKSPEPWNEQPGERDSGIASPYLEGEEEQKTTWFPFIIPNLLVQKILDFLFDLSNKNILTVHIFTDIFTDIDQ